jgi:hypothetical protein
MVVPNATDIRGCVWGRPCILVSPPQSHTKHEPIPQAADGELAVRTGISQGAGAPWPVRSLSRAAESIGEYASSRRNGSICLLRTSEL